MIFLPRYFSALNKQSLLGEQESRLINLGEPDSFSPAEDEHQSQNGQNADDQTQTQPTQPSQPGEQPQRTQPRQPESQPQPPSSEVEGRSQEVQKKVGHTISELIYGSVRKHFRTALLVGSVAAAPVLAPISYAGYKAAEKTPGLKTVTKLPRKGVDAVIDTAEVTTARLAQAAPWTAEQIADGVLNRDTSGAKSKVGKLFEAILHRSGDVLEFGKNSIKRITKGTVNLTKGAFEIVTEPIKQIFSTYGTMLKKNPIPTIIASLALWGWLGPSAGVYTPEAATKTLGALGYLWDKIAWLFGA